MIPVKGYENQYRITSNGQIFRVGRPYPLKYSINPQNGYPYVSLWKENKGKTFSVHRLVAEHFIPNPDNKPNVNHKDSDRTNFCVTNLEWCTQKENIQHGYDHGFMSQEARRKFNSYEMDLLLKAVLAGETITAIASQTGASLGRLSLNMRRHAKKEGLLEEYEKELKRQKKARNQAVNEDRKQPILQLDKEGSLVAEYESLNAAARHLGVSSGNISNVLNGRANTCGGFRWKLK